MHSVELGLPLSVYGSDWEGLIPQHLIKGRFIANDQLGASYASAALVLNDHWDDMRREGFLSNRLFDAVASGARVISDDVDGLHGLFGSSVQVAEDASALQRLVSSDSSTTSSVMWSSDGPSPAVCTGSTPSRIGPGGFSSWLSRFGTSRCRLGHERRAPRLVPDTIRAQRYTYVDGISFGHGRSHR